MGRTIVTKKDVAESEAARRECLQCKQPIIFESQRVTINRPVERHPKFGPHATEIGERLEFDLCLNCWETLIAQGVMGMIR